MKSLQFSDRESGIGGLISWLIKVIILIMSSIVPFTDFLQGLPATDISTTVQPKDQMSDFKVHSFCSITSGAIQGVVPLCKE
jgi:hypothetical protein